MVCGTIAAALTPDIVTNPIVAGLSRRGVAVNHNARKNSFVWIVTPFIVFYQRQIWRRRYHPWE
jgi:hypothetical protein